MYFPDLRSLADVDALAMPEFNLRVHCLMERVRWENGLFSDEAETMQPVANPKKSLAEILMEIKTQQLAQAEKR